MPSIQHNIGGRQVLTGSSTRWYLWSCWCHLLPSSSPGFTKFVLRIVPAQLKNKLLKLQTPSDLQTWITWHQMILHWYYHMYSICYYTVVANCFCRNNTTSPWWNSSHPLSMAAPSSPLAAPAFHVDAMLQHRLVKGRPEKPSASNP